MKPIAYLSILALLALTACGGSSRPTYSGHQESTEGVPGFANGKKLSPYAKLGQSYTVEGETYVPRHQPGYVEEGLASWYGPGFHGGKTANGEQFDKNELTAAHRTLPLPSMVRVTMIETGKSAIVRINDRGPFSKGRIIDLSRAAAEKIGLIGKGVGKVRVEYLGPESERFAALMASGRDPKSIDIESEVLGQTTAVYASNEPKVAYGTNEPKASWSDRLNPISSARAQESVSSAPLSTETNDSADVMRVTASDLAPPALQVQGTAAPIATAKPSVTASKPAVAANKTVINSPFDAASPPLEPNTYQPVAVAEPAPAAVTEPAVAAADAAPAVAPGQYLQLGAFANQANAERLRSKVASLGTVAIDEKITTGNGMLYVVRMGPYADVEESSRVLAQLNGLGINPKPISK